MDTAQSRAVVTESDLVCGPNLGAARNKRTLSLLSVLRLFASTSICQFFCQFLPVSAHRFALRACVRVSHADVTSNCVRSGLGGFSTIDPVIYIKLVPLSKQWSHVRTSFYTIWFYKKFLSVRCWWVEFRTVKTCRNLKR